MTHSNFDMQKYFWLASKNCAVISNLGVGSPLEVDKSLSVLMVVNIWLMALGMIP